MVILRESQYAYMFTLEVTFKSNFTKILCLTTIVRIQASLQIKKEVHVYVSRYGLLTMHGNMVHVSALCIVRSKISYQPEP